MQNKMSTRKAYGMALAELGEKYDFLVLDADLSKATMTKMFQDVYPQRFFNMGIAECDMMSTAAGIASCGKMVFASTFAMFAAGRAYEQIRNSIAYPRLNVKIGGTHGGLLIGEDGGSHQCIEDLSIMRTLPGFVVLAPADAVEARAVVKAAMNYEGPVYMRFGRMDVPVIYDSNTFKFEIGKATVLKEGCDVTIIAVGEMVYEAVKAAAVLEDQGVAARVIDMCSIKPIDEDIIIKAAKETQGIVTVEDHNVVGGLGSAVSEVVTEKYPVKIRKVGVKDTFGRSGKRPDLAAYYGLDVETIVKNANDLLSK